MKKIFLILVLLFEFLQGARLTYKSALNLYNKGEYQKSYQAFEKLFYKKLNSPKINYYLARSAYELKLFDEAIAAYERVLILKKNHHKARLELAKTYFVLKLYEQALNEFEIVLHSKKVPNSVKKTLLLYITKIEELKQKHQFSGFFSLGFESDNNINNGNALLATVGPNVKDISMVNHLHFNHIYNKRGAYKINNILGLYSKTYQQNSSNNFVYSYLSTAPKIERESFIFDMPITLASLNYGNTPAQSSYFLNPTLSLGTASLQSQKILNVVGIKAILSQKNIYTIFNKYKLKNISYYFDKNSTIFNTQLGMGNRSFLSYTIGAKFSYKVDSFNYKVENFYKIDRKVSIGRVDIDNNAMGLTLNIAHKLNTENILLNMGATLINKKYLDLQPTFIMRNDSYNKYYISPTYIIDKKSKISVNISYIVNRSNVSIYTYQKNSVLISYNYSFDKKDMKKIVRGF